MLGILPLSSYPISALPLPSGPAPVSAVFYQAVGGIGNGTIYGAIPSSKGRGVALLCTVIPSYLYFQYTDDPDLPYFIDAYNELAQEIVSYLCGLNLPVYTEAQISGALLDIVANGIYGLTRPTLTTATRKLRGPLNTFALNTTPLNGIEFLSIANLFATTDDVFKRILTWDFYKGDGQVFTISWLKRRIMRFLTGINGVDPHVSQTYQISVAFLSGNRVVITIITIIRRVTRGPLNTFALNSLPLNSYVSSTIQFAALSESAVLAAAIASGAVELPFQFQFIVEVDGAAVGYLFDASGILHVISTAGYPTSAPITAGAIWANSGVVTVVPGVTPNPSAPPVYFPGVNASALLALGGGNLPLSAGTIGSGRLWNNSNVVTIS